MAPKAQKTKSRKSIIFRVCLFAFVVYSVVLLVDMQVTVADRQQELVELERRLEIQETINKDLQRELEKDLDGEDIARIARDKLDYVEPNERVFVDISGS